MPDDTYKDLSSRFSMWLHEDGKAAKTIESYTNDVRKFLLFMQDKGDAQPLSRFAVVQYRRYLEDILSISTINKKINSLKVYNDFLLHKGLVDDTFVFPKKDNVKVASGSEQEVEVLSEDQVEKLLFYIEDRNKVSQRNKTMVYILLYTGLRISELCSLRLQDMDFLTRVLTVRGKGGKYREIGLRQDVIEVIQEYIRGERAASKFYDSPYLLVSQRSPSMHRDAANHWMKQISKELGFYLHPHKLRHTLFTRLVSHGTPITIISEIAGHKNLQTTSQFYIHHSREQKQLVLDQL